MTSKLILLFIATPLVELALLIEVGKRIGLWSTLAIVIVTGAIGATLTKNQGLETIGRIRDELAGGRFPAESLLDGILILVGGLLLLTPGFITDACGFVCLIPPTRRALKSWLGRKIRLKLEFDRTHFSE